jgi:hypothetical protein
MLNLIDYITSALSTKVTKNNIKELVHFDNTSGCCIIDVGYVMFRIVG